MSIVKILDKDLCYYLLQFVHTKDISSITRVNKFFNKLIKRKYSHVNSWKKIKKEIGKGDYYALILAQKYREFSLNDCLYAACRGGSLTLVKEMLKRGADDTSHGFYKACKGGHEDIFDFIVEKEKLCIYPWSKYSLRNDGIKGACIGGHENIMEKILENCIMIDYFTLIKYAFIGNKIQLSKYIPGDILTDYWNVTLYGAAYNNSISLINFALEKGATNMQYALNGACHGGHLNLIKKLVSDHLYKWYWNYALYHACRKGHKNIIDYILDNHKCDINYGLKGSCYGGKLEIIKYMAYNHETLDWNCAIKYACIGRKFYIVKMICKEKIKFITKDCVELCINEYAESEETKKYLTSILEKMEK